MADALLDSEMFILKQDSEASFQPLTAPMRQADALSALAASNPVALDHFRRMEVTLDRGISRYKKELLQLQTLRLGQPPQLDPQKPDAAVAPPSAPSQSKSPNEPGEYSRESDEFAWVSLFTPSHLRPTFDRRGWTSPAGPFPEDKAA